MASECKAVVLCEGASFTVKVCFVAQAARSLLLEGGTSEVGGAERQQALLALELRRRGHQTTFLVATPDRTSRLAPVDTPHGRVFMFAATPQMKHPGVGFVDHTARLLIGLAAADADVYYLRAATPDVLAASLWCHARRRALVYASANDADCIGTSRGPHIMLQRKLDRLVYTSGLRLVDAVLVQHSGQARTVREDLGLLGHLVPNAVHLPEDASPLRRDRTVLSVGRLHPKKGLAKFLDLARLLPEHRFRVVGGGTYAAGVEAVPPNVEFLGHVVPAKAENMMLEAALMVNTSESEGFPNSLLEAWARCLPVVCLSVDPGGVMEANGLGGAAGSLSRLAERVRHLLTDEGARRALAVRGRRYVERSHSLEIVGDRLESILRAVVATRARGVMS